MCQIFRGQADLDDQATLTSEEAQAIQATIQRAAREMKTEVAWMAASVQAGSLLGLTRDGGAGADGVGGFEQLREFTTGVQVVGAAQQEE